MPERHVNIISFDIPVPINYGGAIDVFYKLKTFREAGIKIHLHCFEYDRKPSPILDEMCEEVFYYPREISRAKLFNLKPYIVATRASGQLLINLLKNDYPILFEGLHSCYHLPDKRLGKRKKIVRTHNIEHDYYSNLGKIEKDLFKKYYFLNESGKLRRYEKVLRHADGIAAISMNDARHFQKSNKNVKIISAFHPHEKIDVKEGLGNYSLYHGSLDVGENNQAALYLTEQVYAHTDLKLVIAGNKPSRELRTAIAQHPNVELQTGISSGEIYQLISDAQINVLPTFQATGIKLKLLAALFRGRHCLVNQPMIEKTGLESLCRMANNPNEFKEKVRNLMDKPFPLDEVRKREDILLNNGFSNSHNINQLIKLLFS